MTEEIKNKIGYVSQNERKCKFCIHSKEHEIQDVEDKYILKQIQCKRFTPEIDVDYFGTCEHFE